MVHQAPTRVDVVPGHREQHAGLARLTGERFSEPHGEAAAALGRVKRARRAEVNPLPSGAGVRRAATPVLGGR